MVRLDVMYELTAQGFWRDHACGDSQVGGLHGQFGRDYEKFFTDDDIFRYCDGVVSGDGS